MCIFKYLALLRSQGRPSACLARSAARITRFDDGIKSCTQDFHFQCQSKIKAKRKSVKIINLLRIFSVLFFKKKNFELFCFNCLVPKPGFEKRKKYNAQQLQQKLLFPIALSSPQKIERLRNVLTAVFYLPLF